MKAPHSIDAAPTDEALLEAFSHGDAASLGELAERYETTLLGLASGLLGGRRDLARDAVQDAWVRVIRFGAGFNGRATVRTWLYRITINRCRDLRAREERLRRRSRSRGPQADQEPSGLADGGDGDPALRRAVGHLTPVRREVILLCYHGGISHEQAAAILEIPLGTLKSRLHAALNDLRERMPSEVTP